jgi:hypothetical protein
MGGACGTHGERETSTKIWSENFNGGDSLLYLGVDERILKIYLMVWVRLSQVGVRSAVDLCEHGNEFAVSMKIENYCRIKNNIFWDVKHCSPLTVSRCSEQTNRFYIQGKRIDQARNQHESGSKFCSLSNIPFFCGFIPSYCGTKFSDFPSCVFDKSECSESKTRLLDSTLDVR